MCVLLVEDDFQIRTLVSECLLDAGFKVMEAGSGEEAHVLIENLPEPFKILVTDIHMPGEIDGIGVAQLVHDHWPLMPVIVVSGRPDVFKANWKTDPRYTLLAKPYTLRQLTNAIDKALGKIV